MNCPSCQKEIMPDSYFCVWCADFVPAPGRVRRAGIFARFIACFIDPFIALALWIAAGAIFGSIHQDLGVAAALLFPLLYLVWFLYLLRLGMTPGKLMLKLQVVRQQTGEIPGYLTMLVRETVGRFISGAFLGVGYFWALFDKNAQAWHDKLAGTVVVRKMPQSSQVPLPTA